MFVAKDACTGHKLCENNLWYYLLHPHVYDLYSSHVSMDRESEYKAMLQWHYLDDFFSETAGMNISVVKRLGAERIQTFSFF